MNRPNKTIFLTGSTGVLGAHLLKELLETTDCHIFCLVRAESEACGRDRILACLEAYDPKLKLKEEFDLRVCPIIGDLSVTHFGLSEEVYLELAEKTEVTMHVAANTNLFLNFRRIAPINVGGTENCIAFALATASKYLCYVSTYTVMGNRAFDQSLIFKETDLDVGQSFEFMTYQQSKFIAENIIREASSLGLKWNIFRPGQIFGDSTFGYYPIGQTNVSGLFYDIFRTVIDTGVALISESYFDVVPVDYVSRGIVTLGLRSETLSETYHLTNPDSLHYTEVIKLIEDQGYEFNYVNQVEYKRLLFSNELKSKGCDYKSSTLSAFKWWYKKEIFNFEKSCITDCTYTAARLSKFGVECPNLDAGLIGVYTDESIRSGYFPAPSKAKNIRVREEVKMSKEISV